MHFDLTFAPVLDVDTNPDNPVIGDRSFGSDPEQVARFGQAVIQGLHDVGVGACGKHFPGHGDTDLDSHVELPTVSHDLDRLASVEWRPFRAAVEVGVEAIMTAHVVAEALDPELPATISAKVLRVLRDTLSFRGVIVSDDLDMRAVAASYPAHELGVRCFQAGVDIMLVCNRPEAILETYRGIVQAIERQEISHEALLRARNRAHGLRRRFFRPPDNQAPSPWLGCSEHQQLARTIEEQAARY